MRQLYQSLPDQLRLLAIARVPGMRTHRIETLRHSFGRIGESRLDRRDESFRRIGDAHD